MSSKWRRFEVLLPLSFNDGRRIPGGWISDIILEVVDHFGAISHETQIVEGHWKHEGPCIKTTSSALSSMYQTR
jgi:hypothetical protein